jgi:hypothetical protein
MPPAFEAPVVEPSEGVEAGHVMRDTPDVVLKLFVEVLHEVWRTTEGVLTALSKLGLSTLLEAMLHGLAHG